MRLPLFLLAAALAVFFVGCARDKSAASGQSDQRPPILSEAGGQTIAITPEEGLNGKVAMVNSQLRFVVISFPPGQIPQTDQRLNVYRNGLKVGEVRVTGPQRDDNIIADLVAGDSKKGDVVRER